MPQRLIVTLLVLFTGFIPLWAADNDSLPNEKREANTVVGGTLQKIFSSSKTKRVRRKDTFKRNELGTKESTFSVGLEFEPTLIARYNFHHTMGFNIIFGGSLDHYNKWLFGKIGTHKYDMGRDDLLYDNVKDSTLFGMRLGLQYKNYTPRLVNSMVAPYILIDHEWDFIYWEYNSGVTSDNGKSLKSDLVVVNSLGAGGGLTFFNRSHFRADIFLSGGVRFYQQRTITHIDESFINYEDSKFDPDFYLRSGITLWITREN